MTEYNKNDLLNPEEIIVEESEQEVAQEVEQQEEQQAENVVDKGILIFHTKENTVRYELIGDTTLENVTYYRRFLDRIEQALWDKHSVIGQEGDE